MTADPFTDDTQRSAPAADGDDITVRSHDGPAAALAELLAGNRRFAAGRPRFGHDVSSPAARTAQHRPWALVLGCLDSRVPPEAVLDQDFGSVVVVRTGGHALDEAVLGSVEFAVSVFGVKVIMVLGHQYCGAVETTARALRTDTWPPPGPLLRLMELVEPAIREVGTDLDRAVDRHVALTVQRLLELADVRTAVDLGALAVVGARYQVDTGEVRLLQ